MSDSGAHSVGVDASTSVHMPLSALDTPDVPRTNMLEDSSDNDTAVTPIDAIQHECVSMKAVKSASRMREHKPHWSGPYGAL